MVSRGCNRDTAWFSMLDHEWPEIKRAYEKWLERTNFTKEGTQKMPLRIKNL